MAEAWWLLVPWGGVVLCLVALVIDAFGNKP